MLVLSQLRHLWDPRHGTLLLLGQLVGLCLPTSCGAGQLQALLTFFFSLTLVLTFPRGNFILALEVDVCRGAGRDKWCCRAFGGTRLRGLTGGKRLL